MFYGHPIHGDPSPEEVEEFRQSVKGDNWFCPQCKRWHPDWHIDCWHCNPTDKKKSYPSQSSQPKG
jgi:hypothetical protein